MGNELLNVVKTLNNGVKMPGFGLGVYKVWEDADARDSVRTAIDHGYRLIDTASYYDNEDGVGAGVKESSTNREEIFVTSKVWNEEQGYDETLRAFERSLKRLNFDYLDLYLIHWPVGDLFKDTWKAMERLYDEKLIRAIGVSNFNIHHLEKLMNQANVKPTVNQIEYHPHLTQKEVKAFCESEEIQVEAWSPLKRGQIFKDETIQSLAEKYGKTPAQIILRWDIDTNVITIPKSVNKDRIIENSQIFDFSLTAEEVESLNQLNKNERTGPDPEIFS
ncbi:aldo/keto reductase [Alkalibacillus aidingensis]|uniref:aldo/keto reductase n=1 Tax=Alkalibacillus aidingensis TaxID=2747607 RepID=UPI00166085FF|nr:aldo/keto reductase [Alkalibacillus aidingensis]